MKDKIIGNISQKTGIEIRIWPVEEGNCWVTGRSVS